MPAYAIALVSVFGVTAVIKALALPLALGLGGSEEDTDSKPAPNSTRE